MSKLIDEIVEQISIDKEIIDVSPKTGVKQIREFSKKMDEMHEKYNEMHDIIIKEIGARYDRINSIEQNEEIEKVSTNILRIDSLVLSESGLTSFEKMNLDKLAYNINGYYKTNLLVINKEIYECVRKFREVGIPITAKDFDISEYVKEYMQVLLIEADMGRLNSDKVKESFESVYWKCSDLVTQILMNIRLIYDKNEELIDAYFQDKVEEVLVAINATQKQVENKKEELIKTLNKLKNIDGRLILDSFLNNTYAITDYKDEKYKSTFENIIGKSLDTLSLEEKQDMDLNFEKLYTNLIEYKTYLEFKFLSNEILNLKEIRAKEIEVEKADKKNKRTEYENLRIEVKKLGVEIDKINNELSQNKKGLFSFLFKKKKNLTSKAQVLDRNNKILQLKDLYIKLDNSKLKQKIVENIDDTSSILDVLKIASYYYEFLSRCIIKEFPDITAQEIDDMIERFRRFVRLHDFSVINHVNITEKKDLSVVIKDKYKLLGLNITKDHFTSAGLEDFISQVHIVTYYNDIKRSNIPIEDIQYIMNAKPILKR